MAELTMTSGQKTVIEHSGGALLVSAAAGSGKTFVLVQRLLRMICDPVSPCNVDDFLIITFTKAAAAELRVKIRDAIAERLSDEPENTHLRRQLTRIYLADISTVHAFCGEILRDYAYLLDISSDFVISDVTQTKPLREKALDSVLSAAYAARDTSPEAAAMLESFAPLRNDNKLREHILSLYEHLCCHAFPETWAEECRLAMRTDGVTDVSQTLWGGYLLQEAKRSLRAQAELMEKACEVIERTPELERYLPVFSEEAEMIRKLSTFERWDDLRAACPISFGRMPAVRVKDAAEEKNFVKAIRDQVKKDVGKALEPFLRGSGELLADIRRMRPALCGLLDAAFAFRKAFIKLKRGSRLMDYNDLEHETIRLLTNGEKGGRTEVAEEISKRYREIMVDEYQDTNETQDTIFRAISQKGKNLVMVGDVKQSIYRFRNADPGIFLEKYNAYETEPKEIDADRKVFLSHNFRSRPEILDAANFVFSTVMSPEVGNVEYGEDEALRPNPFADYPAVPGDAIELHLIDAKDAALSKEEAEAEFVADRIRSLLDGENYIYDKNVLRRIRAEDIAILAGSLATPAPYYIRALEKRGIACHSNRSKNILSTTEVQTLIAFLRVADNPHNDIPLLAALASPIGGFTADELAAIRCSDKRSDLYDALLKRAENDRKARVFTEKLAMLRERRHWLETDDFMDLLCAAFRFFPIFGAMKDGEIRCANLRSFLQTLRGGKLGKDRLTAMLRRIDALLESGESLSGASGTAAQGVTIMTVHASKGLEFPIVFLCDLSRQFNLEDSKGSLLLDSGLYLGCKAVDTERLLTLPTTQRNAIALKLRKDSISEDLRLLYVAMTRPKCRLIMTYASAMLAGKLEKTAIYAERPLSAVVSGSVSSMGDWILYAAALRPEAPEGLRCPAPIERAGAAWRIELHHADEIVSSDAEKNSERPFCAPDLSALDRSYDLRASRVPTKLTATQLKGRSPDAEIAEYAVPAVSQRNTSARDRVFNPEKTALSPTEQGTALHQFMQYCDYAACGDTAGVEGEKRRLLEQRFLTERQLAAVDTQKVVRFFQSELGRRVVGAPFVRREFKFSMLSDAGRYAADGDGEELLLQGVIDCYVETDEGIILVDYKTDRVRPGTESERAEAYKPQIFVYAAALREILHKPVIRSCLYFFETGTAIDISI